MAVPVAGREPKRWSVEGPVRAVLRGSDLRRAIGLGMKPGVKSGDAYYDLDHGFLQIFPDSLRAVLTLSAVVGTSRKWMRRFGFSRF